MNYLKISSNHQVSSLLGQSFVCFIYFLLFLCTALYHRELVLANYISQTPLQLGSVLVWANEKHWLEILSWEVSWRLDISTTFPALWVVCLAMPLFLPNSSSLHSPGLHWGPPANFHWNRPWLLGSGNTTFELAVASFVTLSWPLVFLPFKLFSTPFKQVPCIECFLLNSFSYEFTDSEDQRL